MLITDHNVRETLRITDRAYIVHGGVIFKSGTPTAWRPTRRSGGFIWGPSSGWTKIRPRNCIQLATHGDFQQKLHTKLVQKLILTPSLQQAIKLLPMSTLELSDLLNQEMVENPMLEEVPTEDLQPAEAAATPEKPDAGAAGRTKPTPGTTRTTNISSATTSTTATARGRRRRSKSFRRSRTRCRRRARCRTTCCGSSRCRPTIRSCGRSARRSSATSTTTGIWWRRSRNWRPWARGRSTDVERALRLIQSFDPTGVAARDLQECLLLQLRHLGLEGTPTEKIVTEHLRLLQNHQVPEIARKLGHDASTTSRSTSRSSAISIRSRAAATTRRSRSTSSPTSTSSRSRISTSRC